MKYVIKIEGLMGQTITPNPYDPTGSFVKSFDPDGNDGMGDLVLTEDVTKALQFDDAGAAFLLYQAQSKIRPLRPDGRPNKPLTAYTVSVEKA